MYGTNCSMSCGNCVGGEQCHHINGSCLNGCNLGWQPDMCVDGKWSVTDVESNSSDFIGYQTWIL